jgi:hypothetical protein
MLRLQSLLAGAIIAGWVDLSLGELLRQMHGEAGVFHSMNGAFHAPNGENWSG